MSQPMKQISVKINQQVILTNEDESLENILATQQLPKVFAVAVNKQFVAKSDYALYRLCHQDVIAILTPMQGG